MEKGIIRCFLPLPVTVRKRLSSNFAEKSFLGWRSAFSAALKPLLSAGALVCA